MSTKGMEMINIYITIVGVICLILIIVVSRQDAQIAKMESQIRVLGEATLTLSEIVKKREMERMATKIEKLQETEL